MYPLVGTTPRGAVKTVEALLQGQAPRRWGRGALSTERLPSSKVARNQPVGEGDAQGGETIGRAKFGENAGHMHFHGVV